MKTNIKYLIGIAAVLLAGCSSEPFDEVAPVSKKPGAKKYGISVGADLDGRTTRAEYDGVTFRWSAGDKVGFFMAPTGSAQYILSNTPLTGTNLSAAQYADFAGEISQPQLTSIESYSRYDYYSYFPYSEASDNVAFPNAAYTLPSEISVTPDVFPAHIAFMYGGKRTTSEGGKPISWLDEEGQHFGEGVSFEYRHALSYLEVCLAINMMGQPVNKIVVSTEDGSPMAGTANINMETGAMTFVSGQSSSITVNILGDGLDINSASDYNRVWIPINPALAGRRLKFDFYTEYGNSFTQTITAGAMQSGKKHKAAFKISKWHINFVDLATRIDAWNFSSINHKGYDFWCWKVNTSSSGFPSPQFSGGFIGFNADDGELKPPAIKIVNSLGMTDIPVKVSFTASGNAATGDKIMKVGFTDQGSNPASYQTVGLTLNSAKTYSVNGTLSPSKPCVQFKATTWGFYYVYLQQITIEAQI